MNLIPPEICAAMLANGKAARSDTNHDPFPLVKLFTPDAGAKWLLTELDPDTPDIAFGLCDLGLGCPEMGSVSLEEIVTIRGRLGLPVERDTAFVANRPLSAYAAAARAAGIILD